MNHPHSSEQRIFKGVAVSPGVARASVVIRDERFVAPAMRQISEAAVAAELEVFNVAVDLTRAELAEIRDQLKGEIGSDNASLFEAHIMLLDDATVLDEVRRRVAEERESADRIYFEVIRRYIDTLRAIADPYLRERAVDIEDVARRVLRNLIAARNMGGDLSGSRGSDADKRSEKNGSAESGNAHVLVAHDLSPSDTAMMDRGDMKGFATEIGSPTSHTAILSSSLGIPAVVGVHGLLDELSNGDDLLIDGYSGQVILWPTEQTLNDYERLVSKKTALRDELQALVESDTRTADGRRITLSANIEFLHETGDVMAKGAEGVGLFRTEFFYLSESDMRSEERQAEIYSKVAVAIEPHEVIIRTLDVGGDKLLPGLHREPEPNPFLGWRGIRVSLAEPALFKEQLRAILRASAVGRVGIMYPFISSVDEVIDANKLLEEAKAELRARELDYDEDIQIGAMIEIPSAAVMADAIAAEVNFLSIGTNDLVQYTLAVDRNNDGVADCYQSANPAVIRLMKMTVDAAHRNDIWAGVCGEVAGDLLLTPLMVGMEVDELSVGVNQLLPIRRAVSRLDTKKCRALVDAVLQCSRTVEVEALCSEMAQEAYPELLK